MLQIWPPSEQTSLERNFDWLLTFVNAANNDIMNNDVAVCRF